MTARQPSRAYLLQKIERNHPGSEVAGIARIRLYEHLKAALPDDLSSEEYERRIRQIARICGI